MGRGSENLPLARASRPSAVGALRRVPCLADYTGGRLSFGNERAAALGVPRTKALRGAKVGGATGTLPRASVRYRVRPRSSGAGPEDMEKERPSPTGLPARILAATAVRAISVAPPVLRGPSPRAFAAASA